MRLFLSPHFRKASHPPKRSFGRILSRFKTLDVLFGEDQSRARSGYAAENLAALRRWALNLLKTDTLMTKRSIRGRKKAAGWDNRYLLHLLDIN